MRFPMSLELFEQTVGVGKVQLQEVQARLLQILATARHANAGPRLEAAAQGLFYQKAADETAGARYQDTMFHALAILQVLHVY